YAAVGLDGAPRVSPVAIHSDEEGSLRSETWLAYEGLFWLAASAHNCLHTDCVVAAEALLVAVDASGAVNQELVLDRGGTLIGDVALAQMGGGLVAAWWRDDDPSTVRLATTRCRE